MMLKVFDVFNVNANNLLKIIHSNNDCSKNLNSLETKFYELLLRCQELNRKKLEYRSDPRLYVLLYDCVDEQHRISFLETCELFVYSEVPKTSDCETTNPFKVALKVSLIFRSILNLN